MLNGPASTLCPSCPPRVLFFFSSIALGIWATRELNSLLWPSRACQSYMSWPTVGNQFNARLRLSLALRFFVSVSLRAFLQASAADRDVMSCVTLYLSLLLQFLHSVVSTPSVYFAAAPSSACPVSCTDTFNMPGLWLVVILTSQSRLWAKKKKVCYTFRQTIFMSYG